MVVTKREGSPAHGEESGEDLPEHQCAPGFDNGGLERSVPCGLRIRPIETARAGLQPNAWEEQYRRLRKSTGQGRPLLVCSSYFRRLPTPSMKQKKQPSLHGGNGEMKTISDGTRPSDDHNFCRQHLGSPRV